MQGSTRRSGKLGNLWLARGIGMRSHWPRSSGARLPGFDQQRGADHHRSSVAGKVRLEAKELLSGTEERPRPERERARIWTQAHQAPETRRLKFLRRGNLPLRYLLCRGDRGTDTRPFADRFDPGPRRRWESADRAEVAALSLLRGPPGFRDSLRRLPRLRAQRPLAAAPSTPNL